MPAVFPEIFIKGREMFHCRSKGKIKPIVKKCKAFFMMNGTVPMCTDFYTCGSILYFKTGIHLKIYWHCF